MLMPIVRSLYVMMMVLGLSAAILSGCDPRRGCTDPFSDNFDPEAKEDDDTCIPTRLKFIGEFDCNGTSHFGDEVKTSYDQVRVSITDETAQDPEMLIIGITNFDQPIYALAGRIVSPYRFTINQTIGAYRFNGEGRINGRVLELNYTRFEENVEVEPEVFEDVTMYLNLYGVKELED
jgi:hypothetical protein